MAVTDQFFVHHGERGALRLTYSVNEVGEPEESGARMMLTVGLAFVGTAILAARLGYVGVSLLAPQIMALYSLAGLLTGAATSAALRYLCYYHPDSSGACTGFIADLYNSGMMEMDNRPNKTAAMIAGSLGFLAAIAGCFFPVLGVVVFVINIIFTVPFACVIQHRFD